MDSKAYLRYLQQQAYGSDYGFDFRTLDPKSEEAKERINRAKGAVASDSPLDLSYLEKLATNPPWMRLDPMAEGIYKSAIKLVSDKT